MRPSVGRIVHYVSYGTPNGEYPSTCRAAVVTHAEDFDEDRDYEATVDLCVLNPEGLFFNHGVPFSTGEEVPGDPDCPVKAQHGAPFRYCQCGWIEHHLTGGTWHWPERVEE